MGGLVGDDKPYWFRQNQRLVMFNEISILVCCWIMMCFTQSINQAVIVTTINDRKYIGYILCTVVIVVILVNYVALLKSITWQIGFRMRRRANMAESNQKELNRSKARAMNLYAKRLNKQPERMARNHKVYAADGIDLSKIDELNEDGELTSQASSNSARDGKKKRKYRRKGDLFSNKVAPTQEHFELP